MLKQFVYLIIGCCIYLSAFGQEQVTNYTADLYPYFLQEGIGLQYQSVSRDRQLSLKTERVFKQKLDSIIEYDFNEVTSAWDKKFTKSDYTYDENFNEILWIHYAWSSASNKWINLLKEESVYNDLGNRKTTTQYIWSDDKWSLNIKWEDVYNEKNELIEVFHYNWKYDLNDWLLTEKWAYKYNDQGKNLEDILYWKDANTKEWQKQKKVDYQYINNKEIHYIFNSTWDANTEQWEPSEKKWYSYGYYEWELQSLYNYKWDNSRDDWKLVKLESFSYDEDFYLKKYSELTRDIDDDKWQKILSESYTFDFSVAFNEFALPNYLKNEVLKFHHKLISEEQSLTTNIGISPNEQYRDVKYYFSPVTDVLSFENQDALLDNVCVSPIPAKENIKINLSGNYKQGLWELYAINGKKIYGSTFFNNVDINISDIQSGVYIYKIIVGDKKKTGKLVID